MKLAIACCLLLCMGGAWAAKWDKPSFCGDRDCPRFQVERKGNGFETRKYEPALFAWVKVEDVARHEEETMRAFALLFHYFLGDNDQNVTIPMTAPVSYKFRFGHHSEHHHRHGGDCHGRRHHHEHHPAHHKHHHPGTKLSLTTLLGWSKRSGGGHGRRHGPVDITLALYLPYDYQDNKTAFPKPNAPEVQVSLVPEFYAHVRSFGGFPVMRRSLEQFRLLRDALENEEEDFARARGVLSIYDSPLKLENRHNEISVPASHAKHAGGEHKESEAEVASWWDSVYAGINRLVYFV